MKSGHEIISRYIWWSLHFFVICYKKTCAFLVRFAVKVFWDFYDLKCHQLTSASGPLCLPDMKLCKKYSEKVSASSQWVQLSKAIYLDFRKSVTLSKNVKTSWEKNCCQIITPEKQLFNCPLRELFVHFTSRNMED